MRVIESDATTDRPPRGLHAIKDGKSDEVGSRVKYKKLWYLSTLLHLSDGIYQGSVSRFQSLNIRLFVWPFANGSKGKGKVGL